MTLPDDPTDRAFTQFFRAEMPAPWPAAPVPAAARPARRPRWDSRAALAVSVALLLGLGLLASGGRKPIGTPPAVPAAAEADGSKLIKTAGPDLPMPPMP